jgi:hypothetical protein
MTIKSMIINELPLTIDWMIDNALLQTNLDSISEQIPRPCGKLLWKMTDNLTLYVDR